MANAAKLVARTPARIMIAGYPKAGKTGALAALANKGYKIRMLDFDGNTEPLLKFTKPEFLHNIDIVSFEDKLDKGMSGYIKTIGKPSAFTDALNMMDEWKYTDFDGTEVNLGRSKDWGCDTVVVLDSMTAMGQASMRRAMHLNNKTPSNMTQSTWKLAMDEQEAFIEKLTSSSNRFNVIVLAHLKMISPKDIQKNDDQLTKDLKERVADLVPTRLFPNALGQQLPPVIGGHFPTLLLAEPKYGPGKAVKRVLQYVPRPELDLGVPVTGLPDELEISDGLAHIFEKLAPPLAGCFEKAVAPATETGVNTTQEEK